MVEEAAVESPQSKLWRDVFVGYLNNGADMARAKDAANKAVTLYSASFCNSPGVREIEDMIEYLQEVREDNVEESYWLDNAIGRLKGIVARWKAL